MRLIGIDPGVKTGYAEWLPAERALVAVETTRIHQAMQLVRACRDRGERMRVLIEDARLRTWFGGADARMRRSGAGIREGVGSVKRDCAIWEDFLTDLGVPFQLIKPAAGATKWDDARFKKLTGWAGRTSNHARDAAMLVFGRSA